MMREGERSKRVRSGGAGGEAVTHRRVRERHPRLTPRIGLHVTPMIDVVFLLLVYFMVTTPFQFGEEVYRMDLPARGPGEVDPFDVMDEPLRISVETTGAAEDEYALRIDGPYDQPATFEALRAFLDEHRAGAGTFDGLFAADHPIIIAPAGSTRWEHAVEAFNAAARAGYTNITFRSP